MKKNLTTILLAVVLVISMVLGLSACGEEPKDNTNKNATFNYLAGDTLDVVSEPIDTDRFKKTDSIYEVLVKADLRYGFNAKFTKEGNEISIDEITGKGLVPNKIQRVVLYTDKAPQKTDNVRTRKIKDKTFYEEKQVKNATLVAGREYLFAVEEDESILYNEDNFRVEKYFSSGSTLPKGETTPPTFMKDAEGVEYMFVISGNQVVKLDKTGKELKRAELKGSTYFAQSSIITAGDKIICAVTDNVQAFDIDLNEIWTFNEEGIGLVRSDMIYDSQEIINKEAKTKETFESVYVGFTHINNSAPSPADVICLDAKTGELRYRISLKDGFDCGGPTIANDYLILKDIKADGNYELISYNKFDGNVAGRIDIPGRVKSKIIFNEESNSVFFTACKLDGWGQNLNYKESYLCRVWVHEDGKLNTIRYFKTKYSRATATPIIYKNRAYVFSGNPNFSNQKGCIQIVNINEMKEIYSVDTGADCQATPQLKIVDNNGKEELYLFFTLNKNSGDIYYIVDTAVSKKGIMESITITTKYPQYCLSDIVVDSEGTMYYTNDSNTLFGYNLDI